MKFIMDKRRYCLVLNPAVMSTDSGVPYQNRGNNGRSVVSYGETSHESLISTKLGCKSLFSLAKSPIKRALRCEGPPRAKWTCWKKETGVYPILATDGVCFGAANFILWIDR